MKPVIGLVSNFDMEKDGYFCYAHNIRAVEKAGAVPIILPYVQTAKVSEVLDLVSGIVLTGGGDFTPEIYGSAAHPANRKVVPERDKFEFALARSALERKVPTLGICRGMQLLNVLGGGTIYQHTLDELPDVIDHLDGTPLDQTVHKVHLERNSQLSRLCGGEQSFRVNSWHHQAINKLAPGYVVSARSDDGVIEAIEASSDRSFVVGVQWHPEWIYDEPASRNLFDNFARACSSVGRGA